MRVDFETDVGAVRSSNQDSCDCGLFSPNSAWVIVCDGMGGANGGNVASAIAVETIREQLLSGYDENLSKPNLKNLMINAINRANEEVHRVSLERPELHGMGTTVVLLVAAKGTLHVAHVGDSRAYLRHGGVLTQITLDHSYVQDLVNFGQITQEEARVHPKRNIITRVLGVHEEVRCDYAAWDFSPGDLALACSDGLSNYMDEDLLDQYMEEYGDAGRTLPRELIQYAVQCGGSDNITAAVIFNG